MKVAVFFADGRTIISTDILAAELVQAEMGKSLRWTKIKGVWTFTKGGKVVATASATGSGTGTGTSNDPVAAPRVLVADNQAETGQLNCLIIKQPYVDQILAGTKPIEYRSRPTQIRGRIGLVASGGKGEILGTVEIVDCVANEKTGFYHPDSGIDDTLGGPFDRRRCCSLGQRPLRASFLAHALPTTKKPRQLLSSIPLSG